MHVLRSVYATISTRRCLLVDSLAFPLRFCQHPTLFIPRLSTLFEITIAFVVRRFLERMFDTFDRRSAPAVLLLFRIDSSFKVDELRNTRRSHGGSYNRDGNATFPLQMSVMLGVKCLIITPAASLRPLLREKLEISERTSGTWPLVDVDFYRVTRLQRFERRTAGTGSCRPIEMRLQGERRHRCYSLADSNELSRS